MILWIKTVFLKVKLFFALRKVEKRLFELWKEFPEYLLGEEYIGTYGGKQAKLLLDLIALNCEVYFVLKDELTALDK